MAEDERKSRRIDLKRKSTTMVRSRGGTAGKASDGENRHPLHYTMGRYGKGVNGYSLFEEKKEEVKTEQEVLESTCSLSALHSCLFSKFELKLYYFSPNTSLTSIRHHNV